jgi:two-component system nitrate/nitrite response regulator NarL
MKVLMIENELLMLDSLKLNIEARNDGFAVDTARNGAEGLALLARSRHELVLLDWWIGRDSSEKLLEELHDVCPASRILVMSADDNPDVMHRALELGAAGFLRKNVAEFEVLRQALDVVVQGRVYVSGQVGVSQERSGRTPWMGHALEECFAGVTDRQRDVLRVLLRGASDKIIARHLDIAVSTVKSHLQALYRQLGVSGRAETMALAARLGVRIDP